jgi:hypothetical protein
LPPRKLANTARGEVTARLGGQDVRLCVTLGALAELEGYFQVSGFEALAERLKGIGARDLQAVLQALCIADVDFSELPIAFPEAITAVVAAFEAMNE